MPRNTTGGSGHRAQRNSEGSKARNNRCLVDSLLDDYMNDEKTDGVFVGRILKRMGCGRMEVLYMDNTKTPPATQQIIPMRGGLRGKGKKSVWVDLDSVVMIAETGLAGATHEIVAVFTPLHVARLKKVKPDTDERIFMKTSTDAPSDDLFEFDDTADDDKEINVDDI